MGGKTGTTTSSTTIPPEVLARYSAVNKQAQETAGTPFQQYSSDPNAFVAPLNQQQQAATGATNYYANAAQPSIAYAQQGYTPQGYQQGVQGYMNPFLQNAMGSTAAQMQNVNQQEQQKLLGNEVQQGAFGGDRGKVAQAALMNQQNLAMGQTLGQMANQGYQSAAQNYMTGLGQIGNLGIQGQQAGLQGAQAMMGAGTLGQQTEQAGKSALYNQFQQQQAYPFQVAQFLANIAEGTGALSGSTTTQTAPQYFFSDARLKEDIKRVGTAKNGLPIYTFKYKGDDTEQTHTGYMAQDVEKVHPEAVGESHGFKTVDYDKASEPVHKYAGGVVGNSEGGAVVPEHMGEGFASGGDVVGPNDISALLAQQQQSFSPFQQSGIYGGQSGGTPGGKGYVPASNLHVAKLQPSQISSTTQGETLMGDIEGAENIGDRLKKMQGYAKTAWGDAAKPAVAATDSSPAQDAQPATGAQGILDWAKSLMSKGQASGGSVGYASGGGVEPYKTDDAMSDVVADSEKDANRALLKSSISNPKGSSTFGDLARLAAIPGEVSTIGSGIGSVMAALAPIGLASGGVVPRGHFEGGGDTTPDDIMSKFAPAIANIESSGNYGAVGPTTKGGDRAYGKYQVMGANVPSWTKEATGTEMTPDEFLANKEAQDTTFKHHFGKALEQYGSPEDAASVWFSGKPRAAAGNAVDILGTTVPSYLKKFNEQTGAADRPAANAPPAQAAVSDQPGFQAPDGASQKPSPLKGIGDVLSNESYLVPLLSGLAAMAGSKSRYLGSAILEGLGAGAGSYENVQQNIASRGFTNAQTAQQQATTRGTDIANLQKSFQQTPYGNIVWLADGSFIPASDYQRRHDAGEAIPLLGRVPGGPGNAAPTAAGQPKPPGSDVIATPLPTSMTAPAPKGTPVGQAPTDFYDSNSAATAIAEGNQKGSGAIAGGPSALIPIERSKVYIDNVDKMGAAARSNQQNVHELANNLADVAAAKGWNAPGTAYMTRAQISGLANTISRAFGGKDILESDTPAQISDKLRTLQGLMAASGAGQESVRALDELANANANPSQNPKAYARLTSMLMTQTQRGIDQANHANLYGQDSGNSYVNAPADFERKNPSARYGTEAKAIENVMLNDPALFKQMISGAVPPETIDKMFQKHGYQGMSRYFVGGR